MGTAYNAFVIRSIDEQLGAAHVTAGGDAAGGHGDPTGSAAVAGLLGHGSDGVAEGQGGGAGPSVGGPLPARRMDKEEVGSGHLMQCR